MADNLLPSWIRTVDYPSDVAIPFGVREAQYFRFKLLNTSDYIYVRVAHADIQSSSGGFRLAYGAGTFSSSGGTNVFQGSDQEGEGIGNSGNSESWYYIYGYDSNVGGWEPTVSGHYQGQIQVQMPDSSWMPLDESGYEYTVETAGSPFVEYIPGTEAAAPTNFWRNLSGRLTQTVDTMPDPDWVGVVTPFPTPTVVPLSSLDEFSIGDFQLLSDDTPLHEPTLVQDGEYLALSFLIENNEAGFIYSRIRVETRLSISELWVLDANFSSSNATLATAPNNFADIGLNPPNDSPWTTEVGGLTFEKYGANDPNWVSTPPAFPYRWAYSSMSPDVVPKYFNVYPQMDRAFTAGGPVTMTLRVKIGVTPIPVVEGTTNITARVGFVNGNQIIDDGASWLPDGLAWGDSLALILPENGERSPNLQFDRGLNTYFADYYYFDGSEIIGTLSQGENNWPIKLVQE